MGLDVTVYWGLAVVDNPELDEDGCPECGNQVRLPDNPDFPGRADGLDLHLTYVYADADDGFSGGYGRYNRWRQKLAEVAGYPLTRHKGHFGGEEMRHDAGAWAVDGGPFWELINFSDCEGTIGPVVAKKLAADFAQFQDAARQQAGEFLETYNLWRKSFEQASDNGAVHFH